MIKLDYLPDKVHAGPCERPLRETCGYATIESSLTELVENNGCLPSESLRDSWRPLHIAARVYAALSHPLTVKSGFFSSLRVKDFVKYITDDTIPEEEYGRGKYHVRLLEDEIVDAEYNQAYLIAPNGTFVRWYVTENRKLEFVDIPDEVARIYNMGELKRICIPEDGFNFVAAVLMTKECILDEVFILSSSW